MSPIPPWSVATRRIVFKDLPSNTLHRIRNSTFRSSFKNRALHSTSNPPTKTDHILAVLKYAEPQLTKLSNISSQKEGLFDDLFAAGNSLSSIDHTKSKKARIAIYGVNDTSSVNDLVSIFLDDPLASSNQLASKTRERWMGKDSSILTFQYGAEVSEENNTSFLPAPWLAQIPAQLLELREIDEKTIHLADIPILVLNPSPLSGIQEMDFSQIIPPNPHAIIVVDSPAGPSAATQLENEILKIIRRARGSVDVPLPRIVFVDIERAKNALNTLRANPSSAPEIEKYQSDFLASRIPSLFSTIQKTLETTELDTLREDTARSLCNSVIIRGQLTLKNSRQDMIQARDTIEGFRTIILRQEADLTRQILGEEGAQNSLVPVAIERATKVIKLTMDKLSWWKLPVIVDDLSQTVSTAVEKAYLRELQNQLVFHAGRLNSEQGVFRKLSYTPLSSIPSTFRSSILTNQLSQITASPSYSVTPSSLLQSLHSRLAQLQFPTTQLHISAQRAVLSTFVGSFSSTAGAFILWFISYMDAATAFGAGSLGAVVVLRWAIGRWDKARKKWWKDWKRVGDGLERDTRKTLSSVLSSQVFAVPNATCTGLEPILEKHRKSLDALDDQLQKLETQVKSNTPPPPPPQS